MTEIIRIEISSKGTKGKKGYSVLDTVHGTRTTCKTKEEVLTFINDLM